MNIKTRIENLEGKMPRRRERSPTDEIVFGPNCTFEMLLAEFRGEPLGVSTTLPLKGEENRKDEMN